ncbi:MAG: transposase [Actinobacteria bacterium RBG_19FT_COMBO_54_7]|uniref:Transposase n=1 Tax=Candidatus Solincola sediminis TaxID=1797199 RepID=A0A1F2WJ04_9ACTN|nr:MAG: transposase [Candidatus Solincola sediminis]OFW61065.1 MAG: transposase [Candidatus Solincola sediminis]OFW67835.1 MAG: transposase [Actinobacteria bacterium RBG_19FT_COMBO_54_7]
MNTRKRYPPELKERAVRMVFDHAPEYESQWAAIRSISEKFGMSAESLRIWVRQAERDAGLRSGLTTTERERLRQLERENRELKRANEILKSAAAFFGAELDRQQRK